MPVVLPIPIERKVALNLPVDEDPEQEATVTVRQATQAEVEARAELNAETSRVFRSGQQAVEVKARFSYEEARRLEVYLTLSGCNIDIPDESHKDGKRPLFTFKKQSGKMRLNMTEKEFEEAWGQLPAHWAEAIHQAVLSVNPQWNPDLAGE